MGVIIRANAGHIVPLGYFERACKANSSYWGVAFPLADDTLFYEIAGEKPSSDILAENQRAFQENTVMFHLGNEPDGFPADIQQPFVLLTLPDNVNAPILVALLDGDFKSFEDKKERPGMTGEALCVEKYLKPKMEKLFRLCGNDLAKVIKEMQEPDFETDMDRCYGVHGTIVFLANTGECFEYLKNENAKEYPWGFVSQSYDWLDDAERVVVEAAKETNKIKLIKAVQDKNGVTPAPGPKNNVIPLAPGEVKAKPVDGDPPPGRDGTNSVLMQCPKNITKRKNKVIWMRRYFGYLPHDHDQNPKGWVLKTEAVKAASGRLDKETPIKSFQGLPGAAHGAGLDATADAAEDDHDDTGTDLPAGHAALREKIVAEHAAAAPPPVDATTVPLHEKLPVIDPKELVSFKGWFNSKAYTDLVALHKNQTGDPTKFAELESKIPTFIESLGMAGLEETIAWTPAMRYYICCNFPSIGASLANAWIKLAIERGERIDQLEKALNPTGTAAAAPATLPTAPVITKPAAATGGTKTKLIKRATIPG